MNSLENNELFLPCWDYLGGAITGGTQDAEC